MKSSHLILRSIIFLFCTLLIGVTTQTAAAQDGWSQYGEKITASNVLDANEAIDHFTEDGTSLKVKGTVSSLCEKVGCWAQFTTDDGDRIRIKFKNHSFFVPTESVGLQMIAEGLAFKEKTNNADKNNYEYRIEAVGVLLKK